jgi:L-asparagine transporter-like permease
MRGRRSKAWPDVVGAPARLRSAGRNQDAAKERSTMLLKLLAALVAVALMLAYLVPMVVKMKDPALAIVIVIGLVIMLVDLWHSLRKPED